MQNVLNQKPSCLLKGSLAFLLGKGGQDKEASNFICNSIGLGNSGNCERRYYQLEF
jgi:hypothetical protein